MIDHVVLNVSDLDASTAFYAAALEPLGIEVLGRHGSMVGIGSDRNAYFWIAEREPASTGTHVAFTTDERSKVDAFHAAGLAAGGTDNGAPGLREIYSPTYYGAFLLDPDGNNIEAVTHSADQPDR